MNEAAVVFGSAGRLVGIHGAPDRAGGEAAVVLVNSGVVHRVGANRMTVALARRLNRAGLPTFRFDMSMLGESTARDDAIGWEASAPSEIVEAVDQIRLVAPHPVVLYGNCGGAAKSIWAALRDPRVRGLALTNPPPHPAEVESGPEPGSAAERAAERYWSDLATLFERGVRATFVYADGDEGLTYFERRLQPALQPYLDADRLRVVRIPYSNHTFSPSGAQQAALDALEARIVSAPGTAG